MGGCATTKRIALNGRAPSRKLLKACCRFGIGVTRRAELDSDGPRVESLLALAPGSVALVTGASGSGKSMLLKELKRRLRSGDQNASLVDLSSIYKGGRRRCSGRSEGGRSVIDLVPLSLDRSLRLLAAAGLADPFVLGRTVGELSVGERARFALARALAKRKSGWLLIDEFLTTLDRATAMGVGRSFRRAAREIAPELRIVVATAQDDVDGALGADVVVRV